MSDQITLPSGATVELKPAPTFGDDEDAQDYAHKEQRLNAYFQHITVSQVVSWSLLQPVTIAGLRELSVDDGRHLETIVRGRFEVRSSEDGPLENASSTSS